MGMQKTILLFAALVLVIGSIFYLESHRSAQPLSQNGQTIDIKPLTSSATGTANTTAKARPRQEKTGTYPSAVEIVNPSGFINAEKFALRDLVGKKVILLDFWTYSCINCQRTIPYLNAWYEKYKDKGLVIVGMHTPEFDFEKKYDNVSAAVKKFGIQYPVVLDNDYGTWNAYGNRYWPHKYLIDIDGFVVYDHIGEGGYDLTERKIQEALEERMAVLNEQGKIEKTVAKPSNAPQVEFAKIKSPETYFGSSRNRNFGSGQPGESGERVFPVSAEIQKNLLYLSGGWNIGPEFVTSKDSGAKIIFRYDAKDVYLVASSADGARIRVLRDGRELGAEAGADASSADSRASIKEERLYRLIRGADYGEHTIEIIIEQGSIRAFAFTFG